MPTESIENYLKAILLLEEEGEGGTARITTKQIADALEVSQASVSGMIQGLSEEGFVVYEKYKGVRLSEKGRLHALNVLRKHRLVEMLLYKVFHYTWDEVHEEAEALEHAVSDRLADRIDQLLGYPNYDPHGDPIPTTEGIFPYRELSPLRDVEPGCDVRVARVVSKDSDLLRYLHSNNIRIGAKLTVCSLEKFDGQMRVLINDKEELVLSQKVISNLFILKV